MPVGLTLRVMDSVVRVEFAPEVDDSVADEVRRLWARLLADDGLAPDSKLTIVHHADPGPDQLSAVSPSALGAKLAARVTLLGLQGLRGRAFLLHAGAVALDDGGVIAFVGPSGRGKTTAISTIARSHGYVTDETLAVRADGSVIPYPKPLLVGRKPMPKQACSSESLGLRVLPEAPLRLEALVLLDRRPGHLGAPEVTVERLPEALVEIAGESSSLSALPMPLEQLARLVVSTGGVRRVRYTEAADLPQILDLIPSTRASRDSPAFEVPRLPSAPLQRPAPGDPDRYRRADHLDAITADGRLIVLRDDRVSAVGGLGEQVWRAAECLTPEQIVDAVLRASPPPPGIDAEAVVRATLAELIEAQLVQRVTPA